MEDLLRKSWRIDWQNSRENLSQNLSLHYQGLVISHFTIGLLLFMLTLWIRDDDTIKANEITFFRLLWAG